MTCVGGGGDDDDDVKILSWPTIKTLVYTTVIAAGGLLSSCTSSETSGR